MHTRRWIVLGTLASLLTGPLAEAGADSDADQPGTPVAVGSRVRVISRVMPDDPVVGEVVEVDERGLVVKLNERGDRRRRLEWKSVSDAWISLGKRSDPKGGAVKGALAVGIPLALARVLFVGCWEGTGGECLTTGFVIGASAGGLLGAALGSIKTERWRRVQPPAAHLSIGFTPQRGGFGAAVALRF